MPFGPVSVFLLRLLLFPLGTGLMPAWLTTNVLDVAKRLNGWDV